MKKSLLYSFLMGAMMLLTLPAWAQEWTILPTSCWVHEWRTMDVQTDGPALTDENGDYKVYVRSLEQAQAAGNAYIYDGKLVGWDSQFFITFGEENALKIGDVLSVTFKIKADAPATFGTQVDTAPGVYIYWNCIGDVEATTSWTEITRVVEAKEFESGTMNGMYTIAFNLSDGQENNVYFKDIEVKVQRANTIDSWTDIIVNGDMEGESNECFYVTEQGIGGPFLANFTEGIGVDGSRAVKVQSSDNPANDWASCFFIRLPYQIPAGTHYKVSFDYKADKKGGFDTQSHTEPGSYIHYACVGSGTFTTEWQHYEAEGTITSDMSKEGQLFQTICFNLAKNKVATQFIFDNVKFEVPTDVLPTLTKNPAVDPQPYPGETPEEHYYVDLGLPSGTLWATCNVGASSPEDYGDYFAWGETETKASYGSDNYKYSLDGGMTKYCPDDFYGYEGFTDALTELLPEDDAATANWGEEWKMPSSEQIEELLNSTYTTAEVTTLNGVAGYKITSNLNGESIFLPAAGFCYDWLGEGAQSTGKIGGYWSRSLYTRPDGAYSIYYTNSKPICLYGTDRYYGRSVRPVSVYTMEVYTEFVEETGTMTYYYDEMRDLREDITELYDPIKYPDAVRFKDYYKKVTKVAIDPSMKKAPLTSTYGMFFGGIGQDPFGIYALENMTEIDGLENLNTSAVTDMESMFFGCYALTSLDLSSFNTSAVTDMNGMFLGCNKLQTLDLTSFDVSNVTDMRMMFGSCGELTTIYCNDDWSQIVPQNNPDNIPDNMYVMFSGCKKLVGGQGTAFDSNVINGTYARPDGRDDNPGYFTSTTPVVAPENLVTETWYLTCEASSGKIRGRELQIGVNTTPKGVKLMYIQGLCEYLPDAWVLGIVNEENGIVSFASGQFYGTYEESGYEYPLFFVGYDRNTEEICNVVFSLNEEDKTMTTDQFIILNANRSALISYYDYYYDVVISKDMPELPTAVVAPEDLVTEPYYFKGFDTYYEEDETREVQVGFYGENKVYIQGLSTYIPEAWVVGTIEDNVVTIPETYLGIYTNSFGNYEIFFSGATFVYNAGAETFTSAEGYVSYETPTDEYMKDEYKDVVLTKINDVATTPADPEITKFKYLDMNYPYVEIYIPTVNCIDGRPLLESKLYYQLYYYKNDEVTPLVLTADLYTRLEEDISEIPYTFSDNYDVFNTIVYLNQPVEEIDSWHMIGIQSIYYGGGECNKSNIVWFTNPTPDEIVSPLAKTEEGTIFDLQGRTIAKPQKGINIIRYSDGTSRKVLRK